MSASPTHLMSSTSSLSNSTLTASRKNVGIVGNPTGEMFSVRVMRLPSPLLHVTSPISWHPDGIIDSTPSHDTSTSMALSGYLTVPNSINPVFLGETFRACLSIAHHFPSSLPHTGVKLEIQTSSKRSTLVDSTPSNLNFMMDVGETKDYIIQHKVAEIGVNCLVCSVQYRDETGPKQFQKFFKFQVHDPFSIATVLHQRGNDALFAETMITCLIPRPIFLESVTFEPHHSQLFGVDDLNTYQNTQTHSSVSTFGEIAPLKPNTPRSYLFRIRQLKPNSATTNEIGRVQVRWRSQLGETGRLKSALVTRATKPLPREFDLTLISAPASVHLEDPFTVEVEIRNQSERSLDLKLQLIKERMVSILPCGIASRSVGIVPPGGRQSISVSLLPLGLGIQKLSGFRLSCTTTSTFYDYDSLHQISVVP